MTAVVSKSDRPQAFVAEALSYADALYNLARRLTGSPIEGEDLVQETYERALGAWERFTPGTNMRAWLYRILRNAHIDLMRRRRVDPIGGRLDVGASVEPRLDMAQGQSLESAQLRHIMVGELEVALHALSEDARAVILLDLEGLTETEVADVMSCSVGTVKSRLSRARAALRGQLQQSAGKEA
jgi:RNA polymerase sigma-70 factor (ECF subfamily)